MAISWSELLPEPSKYNRVSFGNAADGETSTVTYGYASATLNMSESTPATIMVTETEDISTYDYCGFLQEHHLLHSVLLSDLPYDTDIFYKINDLNSTDVFSFKTPPEKAADEIRILVTADMGDTEGHPAGSILQMDEQCKNVKEDELPVSLGFHVGDIAYNLDLPPSGDNYMFDISAMATSFPWMYASGNHEADCNFTYNNYHGRFAAQNLTYSANSKSKNSGSSRFYSFEQGPVHFIMFDTDAYGFDEVAFILEEQYNWITQDLESVDKAVTPFIFMMSHRPMYCSSITGQKTSHLGYPKKTDADEENDKPEPANYGHGFRKLGFHPPAWKKDDMLTDVGDDTTCGCADLIKNGMISEKDGSRSFGLEALMDKHKVDIYFTGHEHNYERTWPVLNNKFVKSYDKPGMPVHIVTGAGGPYGKDTFGQAGPWDAFRSDEYSYTDVVVNRTHVVLKQRYSGNSTVFDEIVLTQ